MILFKGNLRASDILITYNENDKYTHDVDQVKIEAVWDRYLVKANQSQRKIWDAVLYRLTSLSHAGNKLSLHLGSLKVKEVLAAREGLFANNPPDNVFVASLMRTTDDRYLFGRKPSTDLNNVDMIGGTLSRSELVVHSGDDVLKALFNEFDEEINIQPHHVTSATLIGVLRTQVESVGLIWQSKISINSKEVQERFTARNDGEIKDLIFISEADLKSFLVAQNSYLSTVAELIK